MSCRVVTPLKRGWMSGDTVLLRFVFVSLRLHHLCFVAVTHGPTQKITALIISDISNISDTLHPFPLSTTPHNVGLIVLLFSLVSFFIYYGLSLLPIIPHCLPPLTTVVILYSHLLWLAAAYHHFYFVLSLTYSRVHP